MVTLKKIKYYLLQVYADDMFFIAKGRVKAIQKIRLIF